MLKMCARYLLVSGLLCFANAAFTVKKCPIGDSKCYKESATTVVEQFAVGIPELGVPSLDPLVLGRVDASKATIKLILSNMSITGLRYCKPKKIEHDVPKSKLHVKLICTAETNGNYEMKGRLLVVPMEGKDKIYIKLKKAHISAELDMGEITGTDGKVYWDIKDFKYSYELKDKAEIIFHKLFNGNELLGRAARELVNSNSNEIIMDLGPPIIKVIADKIFGTINKYFHSVPLSEIYAA